VRRLLLRLSLCIADFLLLTLSFVLALLVVDTTLAPHLLERTFYQIPFFLFLAWVVLAWQEGLYRLELRDGWDLFFASMRALLKSTFLLAAVLFFSRSHEAQSHLALLLALLFAFIFLPVSRVLLSQLIKRLWPPCTLLIGNSAGLVELFKSKAGATLCVDQRACGYALFGTKRPGSLGIDDAPLPFMGDLNALSQVIQEHQIDQFLICGTALSREELGQILRKSLALGPRLFMLPDIATLDIAEVEMASVGGQPVLNFNQNLRSPVNAWVKRGIDLVGSSVGLLLLAPLFALLYILIRLDSPGAVFFRHRRFGKDMKYIHVAKFRTMVSNASEILEALLAKDPEARKEWDANLKLKRDPRVTRVGRFLRKTSLDELPQIWNVFTGEMSLVGPRPIVDAEVQKYGVWKDNFMSVRPGMTGLWQVSGRSDLDYDNRVKLDMYYIRNWTIWLDLRIILRTLLVFFEGDGAY
jgi:Undecaprenyl-phosphate galactose phosphotransferase WbaP